MCGEGVVRVWFIVSMLWLFSRVSPAIDLVTEGEVSSCEDFNFTQSLTIYRDPAILLSELSVISAEGGWEAIAEESPVLTTLKGKVSFIRFLPVREFRNF